MVIDFNLFCVRGFRSATNKMYTKTAGKGGAQRKSTKRASRSPAIIKIDNKQTNHCNEDDSSCGSFVVVAERHTPEDRSDCSARSVASAPAQRTSVPVAPELAQLRIQVAGLKHERHELATREKQANVELVRLKKVTIAV